MSQVKPGNLLPPAPNSPCKPWPHKCCPNSGGRWLPVSCLLQTIRLRHRQPVPTGESGTSVLPRAWDSPIPTSTAPAADRIRASLRGSAQVRRGKERRKLHRGSQCNTVSAPASSCQGSGQSQLQQSLLISVPTSMIQPQVSTGLSQAISLPLLLKAPRTGALKLSPSI